MPTSGGEGRSSVQGIVLVRIPAKDIIRRAYQMTSQSEIATHATHHTLMPRMDVCAPFQLLKTPVYPSTYTKMRCTSSGATRSDAPGNV